jgi:hypothetical protein
MGSKRKFDEEISLSNKKLKIEKCSKRKFSIAFHKKTEISSHTNKKLKIRDEKMDENAKYIRWRRDILLYL